MKDITGIELSRKYYEEVAKPILAKHFPDLNYSSALIGWGSEVLGYDTEISRDHHWGPRFILFLSEEDYSNLKDEIKQKLSEELPYEFMGYSTNFTDSGENGVRSFQKIESGPVNHMIDIYTIKSMWEMRIGFDPYQEITYKDWLSFPQQRLLALTAGAIYYDGLGELQKIREKFSYYPEDVWLYMLYSQWTKISQEEAFMGRTGDVGDELGSQIVASRLVREIMILCFLMEKKYYPYTKWFGTAFNNLDVAKELSTILSKVLLSPNWKEREGHMSRVYEIVAQKHNELKITSPLSTKVSSYYGRPYLVIHADEFANAIKENIKDSEIKALKPIGSVDQFTDSSDISENKDLFRGLVSIYK